MHRLSKREWPSRAVLNSEIIFSRVLYEPLLSFDHGYQRAALEALGIRVLDPDTHLTGLLAEEPDAVLTPFGRPRAFRAAYDRSTNWSRHSPGWGGAVSPSSCELLAFNERPVLESVLPGGRVREIACRGGKDHGRSIVVSNRYAVADVCLKPAPAMRKAPEIGTSLCPH